MKTFILSNLIYIIVIINSCSHTAFDVKKESAEEIYNKAVKKLERKKFIGLIPYRGTEDAIELFQQVIDNYPNTKYALLSEIGLADSYFYKDEYDEAQSRYNEFYNLHPGNEYSPYAIYMSGRCFEEISSSYDRDLTPVNNAIAEYTKLLQNEPQSNYTDDARKRLKVLYEKVAKREFYIGRFYYRRKLFHSAIDRFISLLSNYAQFSLRERTLYYTYNSFYKINDIDNAKKYYNQLIEEFPDTEYKDKSFEKIIKLVDSPPHN